MDDDDIFDAFEQELVWLISKAGGLNQLAKSLGIAPSTISRWMHRTRRPSAIHATLIEAYTQGQLPRERIRPDIFVKDVLLKKRQALNDFKKKPFKDGEEWMA